jgi:ribose 1,5-bisphosphokinase
MHSDNLNGMHTGQLFYLMGASGTGKDSLLNYLRSHLPTTARVMLPQRYITRPSKPGGEEHIEITPKQFLRRQSRGDFALYWQSHGFRYGIGREIDGWLAEGYQVVINGSRHYLAGAREHYPSLWPVLIRVSHDILVQRLILRGRESAHEIEQRLQRAQALDQELEHNELLVLDNDGPLYVAGEALRKLILSHAATDHRPPLSMTISN